MGFTNTEPQNHQSENTWFTPKSFIDTLGPFDLDPCTMSIRPFDTAKKHVCYDLGQNGLEIPWEGNVWLNPPYGKQIMPFIDKFIEHKKGVMLIFARMGSEGVQKLITNGAFCFCLRKRVWFITKDGSKSTNAGTDSIVVFYETKYIERCLAMEGVFIKGLGINKESLSKQ